MMLLMSEVARCNRIRCTLKLFWNFLDYTYASITLLIGFGMKIKSVIGNDFCDQFPGLVNF